MSLLPHVRMQCKEEMRFMSQDKQCPTILLPDDPATSDELGGAHQRVTKAISQLIKSESGGITVGLEGKWGSGKSTVVKLLENELPSSDRNRYSIFYFDAWAHEGDPLRLLNYSFSESSFSS